MPIGFFDFFGLYVCGNKSIFAVRSQIMVMLGINLRHKKSAVLAWLLLLVFTPQMVVKSLHYHGVDDPTCGSCCGPSSDDSTSDEEGSSCAICDFTLSLTTEPVDFHLALVADVPAVEYSILVEDESYETLPFLSLRGPPVA